MKETFVAVAGYCRRNWKPIASLGLTAFVGLNSMFELVPPATVNVVLGAATSLGIYLHHKGEPLLPKD